MSIFLILGITLITIFVISTIISTTLLLNNKKRYSWKLLIDRAILKAKNEPDQIINDSVIRGYSLIKERLNKSFIISMTVMIVCAAVFVAVDAVAFAFTLLPEHFELKYLGKIFIFTMYFGVGLVLLAFTNYRFKKRIFNINPNALNDLMNFKKDSTIDLTKLEFNNIQSDDKAQSTIFNVEISAHRVSKVYLSKSKIETTFKNKKDLQDVYSLILWASSIKGQSFWVNNIDFIKDKYLDNTKNILN
ncbi:hypothetical protein V2E24_03415 [Mycoplasmopsis ciconiae]|uniref:Uncharacterized protein n=1 Tax=Mycoplasmopsis ciconiae TaxID=561067 RepID=A0ABU7MMD5_9BACT|nr:hypothetical protein [Mycoplasmopsis ciconiae]